MADIPILVRDPRLFAPKRVGGLGRSLMVSSGTALASLGIVQPDLRPHSFEYFDD